MEIVSYDDCSKLDTFSDSWERLSEKELSFIPSFSELRQELAARGGKFRLLVAIDNSQIVAMACFIYSDSTKRYLIGTRRLLELPVREVSLFGSCVLGEPDESVIRKIFHLLIAGSGFDLIHVGEVFIDSPLHKAITSLGNGAIAWRERKIQFRWLIRLPGSFDEYLASLRATTRTAIHKSRRKLEREAPDFRVMQFPDEVETFLADAEKINRLTYQWDLGYRLCNDEPTRERFTRLAKNGNLRGYILYLRGNPCAFGLGELSHRTFGGHRMGYDPHYRKLSPGTGLLMWMVRDLIENTDCETFDLKWGSDEGYKARFATMNLNCARMELAQIYRPYPLLIVALEQVLNFAKNFIEYALHFMSGRGALRQRLRSAMHRYGFGTH
jgi:hypothetical protein